ncbi:uncharacterized protein MELLADRAFT_58478 [Melampsora larici-populina 98AG31]|uniref:Uncharacterized protein n=1 Tax=Melampsora larici-populina (strain 98AG31 / pathotype 3-4-7) TaxID=747676 RepID=F4R3N1_MELLP|nr:uncharacterized protein MELLADRAFT_58478 [Melampsora larici-populina 98AG31]EGG13140.1 hypothetical protein MELLADRAFT_58478 [Melampsora larici-populina 98AG31]
MASLVSKEKSVHRLKHDVEDSILEERLKIANVILPEDNLEDLVQLRIAPELVSRRLRARRAREPTTTSVSPRLALLHPDRAFTPSSSSENESGSSNEPKNTNLAGSPTQSVWSSPTTPIDIHQQNRHALNFSPTPEASFNHQSLTTPITMIDDENQQQLNVKSSALGLSQLPLISNSSLTKQATTSPVEHSPRLRSTSGMTSASQRSPRAQSQPRNADPPSRRSTKDSRAPSVKPSITSPSPSGSHVRSKPIHSPNPDLSPRPNGPSNNSPSLPRQRANTQSTAHTLSSKPRLGVRSKPTPTRNTTAPLNRNRTASAGRPRSLSVSSISSSIRESGALPPWSTDPSPRLYRVDPKAEGVEPGFDDMILPAVARQLEAQQKIKTDLAESSKLSAVDISEWDPAGTPMLIRKITPPPPPLAEPKAPTPTPPSEHDHSSRTSFSSSSRAPSIEYRPTADDDRPIRPAQPNTFDLDISTSLEDESLVLKSDPVPSSILPSPPTDPLCSPPTHPTANRDSVPNEFKPSPPSPARASYRSPSHPPQTSNHPSPSLMLSNGRSHSASHPSETFHQTPIPMMTMQQQENSVEDTHRQSVFDLPSATNVQVPQETDHQQQSSAKCCCTIM